VVTKIDFLHGDTSCGYSLLFGFVLHGMLYVVVIQVILRLPVQDLNFKIHPAALSLSHGVVDSDVTDCDTTLLTQDQPQA
jgi:hypothetical protein